MSDKVKKVLDEADYIMRGLIAFVLGLIVLNTGLFELRKFLINGSDFDGWIATFGLGFSLIMLQAAYYNLRKAEEMK